MKVELGPFPSEPARNWLEQASALTQLLQTEPSLLPFAIPTEVLARFRTLLGEFIAAAEGDRFYWVGLLDPADLQTLMRYWLNLAVRVNEHSELPGSDKDSQEERFYLTLVDQLLGALSTEAATAGFAARARQSWPGLGAACLNT